MLLWLMNLGFAGGGTPSVEEVPPDYVGMVLNVGRLLN